MHFQLTLLRPVNYSYVFPSAFFFCAVCVPAAQPGCLACPGPLVPWPAE